MLLSIKMKVGETLWSYASRYWELYNEFRRRNEKIVASTFKMGLPEGSKLRELLTKRPPEDMRRIKEYKRLKDDQLQNKGKAPLLGRALFRQNQKRISGCRNQNCKLKK